VGELGDREAIVQNFSIVSCAIKDSNVIIAHIVENLWLWDKWAFASKIFACVVGSLSSIAGILVTSKVLQDKWHYFASAILAAGIFTMGVLQPYEEYKQFRGAYANLERAYLEFINSKREHSDLRNLIAQNAISREKLVENWAIPDVAKGHK